MIRKHGNELKKEVDKFKMGLKENKKQQNEKKVTFAEHLENTDKCKGPFKAEFDKVTDSFKLEQTVYHSGALAGNDVNKLTKTANIKKLCNVFKPQLITLEDGSKKRFGSDRLVELLMTRFTKFTYCYDLYKENRHLCSHEGL